MALPCQVRKAEIRRARDKLLIWKRGWRDSYKDSAESGDGSATSQPGRILIQECSNPPHAHFPPLVLRENQGTSWANWTKEAGMRNKKNEAWVPAETEQRSAELWGHFPSPSSCEWNLRQEAEDFQTKAEEPQEKKKKSQDLTFNIFPVGKVLKVRPSSRGDTTTQQVCHRSPDLLLSS